MTILSELWVDDQGQDIAEYTVLPAVILVVVISTIRLIGSNANNAFSTVASSLQERSFGCLLTRTFWDSAGGVDGESSFRCTSVGMDAVSGDVAVRVLRDPVACGSGSSIALGSGRRSAHTVWTDAECPGDRRQCWSDARCRHALQPASCEPDVAGGDA
jgi:Flp pilus assembly pilin Flp